MLDRRTFVKAVSAGALALAAGCAHRATAPKVVMPPPLEPRRRFALVGTGVRSGMYRNAIHKTYKDYAVLVGLCDKNPGRLALAQRDAMDAGAMAPPAYAPADFEKMLHETRPDHVIVTSMCSTHSEYIVRTMNAGFDVITEKPLTTTAEKCQQIFDAKARTGRKCRVTFNYRYSPPRTQIKDILMSGAIGEVLSVDFHWMLNTFHGADYFRRWHRQKANSGGLMVHKATHHFDLVNWWLGAVPVEVFGTGKREFYTPATAKRMGLSGPHERCLTCPEKDKCGFYIDISAEPTLKALYLDNEKYDGYFRDRCVFGPEIDIEDTMNVLVKYDNGVTMAYSCNAFNSWEGYIVAFNGTKGRLEQKTVESIFVPGKKKGEMPKMGGGGVTNTLIPIRGPAQNLEVWTGSGGHGGGDKVLLDELFLPQAKKDKYLRAADERAGAASILIGVAANKCFKTGQPVKIAELVSGLSRPDYAPMPSRTGPLPMPGREQATKA